MLSKQPLEGFKKIPQEKVEEYENKISNFTLVDRILDESIGNYFDWIKLSKNSRNFVFPKKANEEVDCFSDGLKDIIPQKLQIALKAQEQLCNLRKKRINLVLDTVPLKNQWFYLQLEAILFSEYFVISSWLNYWLDLWAKVNTNYKSPVIKPAHISDNDIQLAKEHPIENLYEGRLRKCGNRLQGLCPFHEEKTPSFFIFPDNHWYCFGACCTGGDAINLAMKLYNIGFIDAVRRLSGRHY